jgi:hypothetical protein
MLNRVVTQPMGMRMNTQVQPAHIKHVLRLWMVGIPDMRTVTNILESSHELTELTTPHDKTMNMLQTAALGCKRN